MNRKELLNALFSCQLFKGVNISETDFDFTFKNFKKGENLFAPAYLGILIKGTALIKKDKTEKVINIRKASSGEIFGVSAIFGGTVSDSLIICCEECTVCYINEENLKKLFKKFPETVENYIKFLTDRINFLNKKIAVFSADSTEQKVLLFLNQFADESKNSVVKISATELSRRISVGRTSLYRALDNLQANQIILRENNKITIL